LYIAAGTIRGNDTIWTLSVIGGFYFKEILKEASKEARKRLEDIPKDRNKSSPAPSQLLLPTLPAPPGMSLLGRLSHTFGFNKVISCPARLLLLCPGDARGPAARPAPPALPSAVARSPGRGLCPDPPVRDRGCLAGCWERFCRPGTARWRPRSCAGWRVPKRSQLGVPAALREGRIYPEGAGSGGGLGAGGDPLGPFHLAGAGPRLPLEGDAVVTDATPRLQGRGTGAGWGCSAGGGQGWGCQPRADPAPPRGGLKAASRSGASGAGARTDAAGTVDEWRGRGEVQRPQRPRQGRERAVPTLPSGERVPISPSPCAQSRTWRAGRELGSHGPSSTAMSGLRG